MGAGAACVSMRATMISPRRSGMRFLFEAKRRALAAFGVAVALAWPALAPGAAAKTLRFAFQGELRSVDPYQINESFSLSVNLAVYEGLVQRGPVMLHSDGPGVKTVSNRKTYWWDKPSHNLDEVVFTPIANSATRVAALLSGEIDWMDPVPLNAQARVDANPDTQVLAGPEVRT